MTELADVLASVHSNPHIVDAATSELFTVDECCAIVAECADAPWLDDPPKSPRSAKRSKVERALPGGNAGWIGQRLAAKLREINDEIFEFRVVGLEQPIKVVAYEASASGYISRHSDLSARRSLRKLTFSVLLSDPRDVVGGDLVFLSGPADAARRQGVITVFPSFTPHEVTPVTTGRRVNIVGWVLGPTFT